MEIDPRDRERAREIVQAMIRCHAFPAVLIAPRAEAPCAELIAEALSQVRQESQQEIASLKAEMRRTARAEIEELGERAEAAEARLRDLEGRTDDGPQPPQ